MENNKYTFWKLLDENSIEIPIIQRDYAQGREEENKIRDKFLDVLHNKIVNINESVNLDFVYGRIIDKKLIPLDGQQRLTTLFLLHWYLAIKDNELTDSVIDKLQKFTYETRVSSREFCQSLSKEQVNLEEISFFPEDKQKLSSLIEDKNWFFKSWTKDPTIKSMLIMLDAIHDRFKDSDSLFINLISDKNPPITFDFLPLDDFNLTDELYIKMNARGKPLTHFENFKSNFVELLDSETASKLDNEWTDLFWSFKGDEKEDGYYYIDDKYFNFFTNCTVNFYFEKNNLKEKQKVDDVDVLDIYQDTYDENNIERVSKLLDSLCNIVPENNILNEYFKTFIEYKDTYKKDEDIKVSYWDRARFYAISLFLIKYKEIDQSKHKILKKWLRVTFNLINNELIQSPELFANVIRGVKKLSEYIDDIYNYLSQNNKLQGFNDLQVKEESLKANLILNNPEWEEFIIRAEEHWYLDGQIGFFMNYSKENNTYHIDTFKKYLEKFELLFTKEVLNSEEYLFHRALLSKGDYLQSYKSNYTFCSSETALRTKRDNWRKVFNDFEDDSRISHILKDLLYDIDLDKDAKTNLNRIIQEFNTNDWREGFVKESALIEYCSKLQIRFKNKNDILLLKKERTSGQHAEYYTYWLYLEIKKKYPNIQVEYKDQSSIELPKYISINDDGIKITYGNDWFYKKEFNNNEKLFKDRKKLLTSLTDLSL